MEQLTKAEALREEYLELLAIMYGTCLTGFSRAKAYSNVSFLGMLITQGALFGALFFVDQLAEQAVVAILIIVSLAALWWFGKCNKEFATHEEVKREYEMMEQRLASLEREYKALTGTELRGTLTAKEVRDAFEPVLTKRGIPLPPIEQKE
jgi:hypothetical protein